MDMRAVSQTAGGGPGSPSGVQRYSVLPFASRSEAVKLCLTVSDALESAAIAGDGDIGATLWLAAAATQAGAVNVYACDRAVAAARTAGLAIPLAEHITENELPPARCLVIGDPRLLEG